MGDVLSQMAKPDPKILFHEATEYLKQHPEEILRALRGALGLRLGLPMDAIRYLVREFGGGSKAPKDVVIEAAPPGVRVGLTIDAMGTPLRAVLTAADGLQTPTSVAVHNHTVYVPSAAYLTDEGPDLLVAHLDR